MATHKPTTGVFVPPVQWDGTGLPPVGAICLMFALVPPDGGSPTGEKVTIAGYFGSETWVKHATGSDIMPDGSCYFQPLKSSEDILVDEAMDFVMESHYKNNDEDVVRDLIKAGYRKVTPENIVHLDWIHNRLTVHHNENYNMNFLIAFRKIIDTLRAGGKPSDS